VEGAQRVRQVGRGEIGPHDLREVQLRVSAFPQQEVGEALLTAGADQQVHVREDAAVRDRRARRVVDGEAEPEPRAGGGGVLGGADGGHERGGEPIAPPDDFEADAVFDQPRRLGEQMAGEQAHQRRDLARRAFPVVGGEGE